MKCGDQSVYFPNLLGSVSPGYANGNARPTLAGETGVDGFQSPFVADRVDERE